MKYTIDKNNWEIRLDNEAVKAIRFCRGFNTDLRVSLKYINRDSLFWWLYNNRYELFGACDMMDFDNDKNADFERTFNNVVSQIVR